MLTLAIRNGSPRGRGTCWPSRLVVKIVTKYLRHGVVDRDRFLEVERRRRGSGRTSPLRLLGRCAFTMGWADEELWSFHAVAAVTIGAPVAHLGKGGHHVFDVDSSTSGPMSVPGSSGSLIVTDGHASSPKSLEEGVWRTFWTMRWRSVAVAPSWLCD